MKILNLYAGIGGNRKLWGNDHEITAVELRPEIAAVYQDFSQTTTWLSEMPTSIYWSITGSLTSSGLARLVKHIAESELAVFGTSRFRRIIRT